MPASMMGEIVLRVILEFVFYIVGYFTGCVVVPVFSFGRLKCDRMTADTPRRKLKWGGTFHRRGQQIYLTAEATACIGVIFVVLVIAAGFLIIIKA